MKSKYISDIAEDQPWSQKMGQVQYLQASGKPKPQKTPVKVENPKIKEMAKKLKRK